MAKIEIDLSAEFDSFREEIREEFRKLASDLRKGSVTGDAEWVSLHEAKLILGYQSKKKWKELRDTCQVDFAQVGRAFKYHRGSLIKLIEMNSTLKSQRNAK
jgi:hypothetical protein